MMLFRWLLIFDLTTAIHCRLSGTNTGDVTAVNARSGFTADASR